MCEDKDDAEEDSAPGLGGGLGRVDDEGTAVSWQVDRPPMSMSEPVANSDGGSTFG